VITDPPYNVPIAGHVSGLGNVQHQNFQMASGELSQDDFAIFLGSVFRLLVAYAVDGSIHQIFMDWRHLREMLDAGEGVFTELKNLCVWVKSNGGMGSFYGFVTLSNEECEKPASRIFSSDSGCRAPRVHRRSTEGTVRRC
jgi:hypothetical protein